MLVAKGYGSANPVASNDTAEGKFRNRRIEYLVVKPA
jgi:outer membrane protein OmpA-like peptidoglycan-associated protein